MTTRRFRQLLNARFAGVLLSAVSMMLAGCATTPQLADATEATLPLRAGIEGVPFHAQREYQCGPASLAMVLNSQGVDVQVDTLIPQVFIPEREGSVQPEMLATTRRNGLIPFVLNDTFDALLTEIAAGHPVVVMQNLSLPAWPMWHYAVAIGYDRETKEMILHSGEEAERIESFRRFDATWARSDRWAFVALPPGQLPEAISAYRALDAIASYEQVQGPRAALPAWEAFAVRFPTTAMGHFALGNARHVIGNQEGAIEAFREAVRQDDELAVAWLNLGLSLRNLGDDEEAHHALSKAAEIPGQWQAQAREALKTY
jgi:tetratricopeptide (TPR) repeat protein